MVADDGRDGAGAAGTDATRHPARPALPPTRSQASLETRGAEVRKQSSCGDRSSHDALSPIDGRSRSIARKISRRMPIPSSICSSLKALKPSVIR